MLDIDIYYLKIKIDYVDYETVTRETATMVKYISSPQKNASTLLQQMIKNFYENNPETDILSIEIIENAIYKEGGDS